MCMYVATCVYMATDKEFTALTMNTNHIHTNNYVQWFIKLEYIGGFKGACGAEAPSVKK